MSINTEVTTKKRDSINRITGRLCGMLAKIQKAQKIVVADMTAGDGCLDDNSTAKTLAKHAGFLKRHGKNVRLFLNDQNTGYAPSMRYVSPDAEVSIADYGERIVEISKQKFDAGIVLFDPYGTVANLDKIALAAQAMPCVDFIFSIGAAGCKRAAVAHGIATRTSDIREAINRQNWYVLAPFTIHQWTLLLGTRTARINEIGSIGFFNAETKEGAEVCKRIDHTESELLKMGIPHTRNTCATRSLEQLFLLPKKGLEVGANLAASAAV